MYQLGNLMTLRQARKPKALRMLRAKMEEKELSLKDVSELANVGYTLASDVLNGRQIRPEVFKKLRFAIEAAPNLVEPPYPYSGYPQD
jgi:hypothetical protein